MTEHGIEVYVDGHWLFILALDREQAVSLQAKTVELYPDLQSRQVIKTPEGFFVKVHATE